jgi:hydroxymethylpyrimidine/phosphomethylpyrimidine kinase
MLTKKESEKESIKFLLSKGIENIYVTGKVENNKIINSLYSKGVLLQKTESDYLDKAIHGTGCALSTAILCNLVNQKGLKDSCLISHKLLSNLVHKSFETNGQDILSFK